MQPSSSMIVEGTNTADVVRNDIHSAVPQKPINLHTHICGQHNYLLCDDRGISHNVLLPDVSVSL